MKTFQAILCLVLFLMLSSANAETPAESTDFAGQLRLNMASETVKTEVTVKTFVDGDTTHFMVPVDVAESGVLRARYLAVNTPEITGKVEEYGKKAAQFTKERLSSATSIIIESENSTWNPDSTGSRYLVWVWYKTADSPDYRNLNIEILQNGLALPNSAASGLYG
jgi:endonuclease YncB( thermonuclease family)